MNGMSQHQMNINSPDSDILIRRTMDDRGRRGVCISDTPPATLTVKGFSTILIGRRASVGGLEGRTDWPCAPGAVDNLPGGIWIDFIRPEEVQHIKLETLIPPWTVTWQVYMESLTSRHSGISNDILLFSDIGLSLTHHYRVHKRGVPHAAFCRNYMSQLRSLLPLPAGPLTEGRSPDPGSLSVEDSPDVMTDSSRPSRNTRLHAGA